MCNSYFHLVSWFVKLVFTVWIATRLITTHCSLNTACANNNICVSNALVENPILGHAMRLEIEKENLSRAWESIMELYSNSESNSEIQTLNNMPEVLNEFANWLAYKLFPCCNELEYAVSVLRSNNSETFQIVSELLPQLLELLLREYKLITRKSEPETNNTNNIDNTLEIDMLRMKINQGKHLLLKLICITGLKQIRDEESIIRSNTDIAEEKKQHLKEYYIYILKLFQAIHKIDSEIITTCRDEISIMIGIDYACEVCSVFQNNCKTVIKPLKRLFMILQIVIEKHENVWAAKQIELPKKISWILQNVNDKLTEWKPSKEITNKDMLFLDNMLHIENWQVPYWLINEHVFWKYFDEILKVLRVQILSYTNVFKANCKVHERNCLAKVFFGIFNESLLEIINYSVSIEEPFLKPALIEQEIVSLKTALIISEGKECNAKLIKEVYISILNIDLQSIILCDDHFPGPLLSLLHAIAEYMIKTGVNFEPFKLPVWEIALEEFFNKDRLFIKDIIDLYFLIRSLKSWAAFGRQCLWSHTVKLQIKRGGGNNRDLEINKARGIILAFFMLQWNSNDLCNLENGYCRHYCDIPILKELNAESNQ